MAQKGKTQTVLLRSTAPNPKDPKRKTGCTYVTTRPTSHPKLKEKKYDWVVNAHVMFEETKAKN